MISNFGYVRMGVFYKQTDDGLTKTLQNSKYENAYHKVSLGDKAEESFKSAELLRPK